MFDEKRVASFLKNAQGVSDYVEEYQAELDVSRDDALVLTLEQHINDERGCSFIIESLDPYSDDSELRQQYPEFKPDTPSSKWRLGMASVRIAEAYLPSLVVNEVVLDPNEHLDDDNCIIATELDDMFRHRQLTQKDRNSLRLLVDGIEGDKDRALLKEVSNVARGNLHGKAKINGRVYHDGFLVRGIDAFALRAQPGISFIDWFIEQHSDEFVDADIDKLRLLLVATVNQDLHRHFPRS